MSRKTLAEMRGERIFCEYKLVNKVKGERLAQGTQRMKKRIGGLIK
ncbi:MAG: hypothetical protein V1844_09440 [Pseudomonadota bacterium]